MALTHNTTAQPSTWMMQIAHLRADFDHWRARRAVYRRTLRELSALGTHELADLGLNRSMLRGVAWNAANKV